MSHLRNIEHTRTYPRRSSLHRCGYGQDAVDFAVKNVEARVSQRAQSESKVQAEVPQK